MRHDSALIREVGGDGEGVREITWKIKWGSGQGEERIVLLVEVVVKRRVSLLSGKCVCGDVAP